MQNLFNRSKFSATASLGVIHRGQVKDSLALMQNYLPKDTANSSGYAEGGCLYALGLIHANHGGEITDYLLGQVREISLSPFGLLLNLPICNSLKIVKSCNMCVRFGKQILIAFAFCVVFFGIVALCGNGSVIVASNL